MKNIDNINLDYKSLSIFKSIYEEGSVTEAAQVLGYSQSLLSHTLDKLRNVFDDPLFVRSGRKIEPTERAHALAPDISDVLEHLNRLSAPEVFNPAECKDSFTLSANDLERAIIGPQLLSMLLEQAPNATLKFIDTRGETISSLRKKHCDVILTPIKPKESFDVYMQSAFELEYSCCFDDSQISESQVKNNYLNEQHGRVVFSESEESTVDKILLEDGHKRNIKVYAPSFTSLAEITRGTRLISTVPVILTESCFSTFASCDVPFDIPKLQFYMLWHKSSHYSAKHQWFRSLIKQTIRGYINEK